MRRLLFASLLLSACAVSPGEFPCTVDSACVKTGQSGGACISNYCAFSDPLCSSGMRWDQTASSSLRNTCVSVTPDAATPDLAIKPAGMPDLALSDLVMPTPPDLLPPPKCTKTSDCLGGLQCCVGICVDTTSDRVNCGTCGTPCQGGWNCCQSVCSNPTNEVANCGGCGMACNLANSVPTCTASHCAISLCNATYADCDKQAADGCEVNTQTDVNNCGGCGMACAPANATPLCTQGVCTIGLCNANYVDCNKVVADGCEVNTQTDAKNCGACNAACNLANAVPNCAAGVCTTETCNANYADCDKLAANGCEVNTQTDVKNCGGCAMTCSFANATPVCMLGACAVASCNAGYAHCDKVLSDGCEVNTQTDVKNCGGCGMACALANATPTCTQGACAIGMCNANYVDCNKVVADGCEVNTQTDTKNCGACGTACALANATQACVTGACAIGICNANYADCDKVVANGCEVNTQTDANNCGGCGTVCAMGTSCVGGVCVVAGPSCAGLAATCGPNANDSCCNSAVVTGGTYFRSYDVALDMAYPSMAYPATVSDFRLDKYLITVGRFRTFVNAGGGAGYGTQAMPPAAGAGAHGKIANSGWQAGWNTSLTTNQATLMAAVACDATYQTWTANAGANETRPMNCITWFEAMAFCAWDGGYLPTEAEWNYAAAGGTDQRAYPWSNPASSVTIDCTYANYWGGANNTTFCYPNTYTTNVGLLSPKGDAKWGQSDLGGNLWEWNLDWDAAPYLNPCTDCANLTVASYRVLRGGYFDINASYLRGAYRFYYGPVGRSYRIGFRCARTQ